jgi:tryptophan 2,3-dioxygenase
VIEGILPESFADGSGAFGHGFGFDIEKGSNLRTAERMEKPDPKTALADQIRKLEQKYQAMGQDLSSYLDGLLHADYLTYWDYIHLDTLLSLQSPKTSLPDEKVFIIYHQITELYFNLVLWEMDQIAARKEPDAAIFCARLDRIIRYFRNLEQSFDIMTLGLEKEQFLKFRMSLLPSSGFQSAQYRKIELCSTDLVNLVATEDRLAGARQDALIEKLYWRKGATELASGQKTLTLRQFEQKYLEEFRELARQREQTNLYRLFLNGYDQSAERESIVARLRELDTLANVLWPLAHLKSAGRFLQRDPEDIKATGGTNWQKYLPPRFQRVIFFPTLWSDTEKAEWGRAAVQRA